MQTNLEGIVIAAALALPVVLYFFMMRLTNSSVARLGRYVDESGKARDENFSKQFGTLIDNVSPRVVYCKGASDVVREATSLIEQALDKFWTSRKIIAQSTTGKNESGSDDASNEKNGADYRTEDFITIYGSTTLGESDNGCSQQEEAKDDTAELYAGMLRKAMLAGIRFRRYVNLLKPEDLKGRSEKVRQQYASWLGRQYDVLVSSTTSELIDNIRAPRWGTSNTSFLTNEGILEIKAGGNTALAVFDPVIAATMRASMREEIEKADPKNNQAYAAHIPESIEKLMTLVLDVCSEVGIDVADVSKRIGDRPGVNPS